MAEALNTVPVQAFKGDLLLKTNQSMLKGKIRSVLERRNLFTDINKEIWKSFFKRLPNENDLDRPKEHQNILAELVKSFGHMRVKQIFLAEEADLNDYGMIDAIRYTGGPIDEKQQIAYRRTLEDGVKGCIKKRKNCKSGFSDDDEEQPATCTDTVTVPKTRGRKKRILSYISKCYRWCIRIS